jgi:DeoR family glycerol-3-phosphate regulon repressor
MTDKDKKSRQSQLMLRLEANRFVSLDEIASAFAVTTQTARRDLMDLEGQGLVRRLHGGAMLATPPFDLPTYRRRRVENAEGKRRIGNRVAELLADGSSAFLDTGSTCESVARALTVRRDLRIVTYSLRAATVLSDVESFAVAVPGGFVRHGDAGVFRHDVVEFIGAFKFDSAIISVSGIDEQGDMGDDDHGEVQAVRAAMRRSHRIILAVDGSKFGKRALVRLGSVAEEIDIMVTDVTPPSALAELLVAGGVAVEVV